MSKLSRIKKQCPVYTGQDTPECFTNHGCNYPYSCKGCPVEAKCKTETEAMVLKLNPHAYTPAPLSQPEPVRDMEYSTKW